MATIKPTVVFIPGFWHTPEGFTSLSNLLQAAGYPTHLVSLPSTDTHPGHADFTQDVSAIRVLLTSLAKTGQEIILFMHSGGSISGSEATRGLSKKELGWDGGVVQMIYVAVLLPTVGKSMFETFYEAVQSPDVDEGFFLMREGVDMLLLTYEYAIPVLDGTSTITDGDVKFYNDLPEDEAKYWSHKMVSQSLGVGMSPLTYAAWKFIPSAFIVCLKDKSIPLKQVRKKVKEAGIERVLEIGTGHCPYLAKPEVVAAFVRKVAGE